MRKRLKQIYHKIVYSVINFLFESEHIGEVLPRSTLLALLNELEADCVQLRNRNREIQAQLSSQTVRVQRELSEMQDIIDQQRLRNRGGEVRGRARGRRGREEVEEEEELDYENPDLRLLKEDLIEAFLERNRETFDVLKESLNKYAEFLLHVPDSQRKSLQRLEDERNLLLESSLAQDFFREQS